jgi:hypothetical protein
MLRCRANGRDPKERRAYRLRGIEAVIPLSSLIDPEKEKARIQKEIERVSRILPVQTASW